jgi:hypothetical protein
MKKLGYLALIGASLMLTTGCDSTCGTFCEYYVTCTEQDIDEVGCNYDDDFDDVLEDCQQECEHAYDRLNDTEAEEFDICVDCAADDIGAVDECRDGDLGDAVNDHCRSDCNDDGPEEFWEDFDLDIDLDC